MKETLRHELEQLLRVSTLSESQEVPLYTLSASDIFRPDGYEVLLNNKRFHFRPVANPDLEETLKMFHPILAESKQPELAYDFSKTNTLDTSSQVYWKKRAAELGHASAQDDLGDMYYDGNGVPQDYTEAVKWYRKAAEQGNDAAQWNLGYNYFYGKGVSQDYSEAVKWYRKAAEQGYASAQNSLGYMYATGKGVPQDYTEAVKWYRKAAEQGNDAAQWNLGYNYFYGNGVLQDRAKAIDWFLKAAKRGNANAKNKLKELGYSLSFINQKS